MSTIQPKSHFSATDLRNIREAVKGPSPFKSVANESAQVSDGKQDVFIMAPDGGGLFRSAESANANVAESLQDNGVQVTESFDNVGVSARVSPEKAEADYGVVIDLARWKVDETATQRRRDEIRKARGWTAAPKVQRHDPLPLARAAE